MKLTLTNEELDAIHKDGEERYLAAKGFDVTQPVLRLEWFEEIGEMLSGITFLQDETPDKGGDNIECELLKSMGGGM